MIRVKIAELRDGLSRYLRAVESGETVEVMHRDRPVARLVPAAGTDELAISRRSTRPKSVRAKRYPPAKLGFDIVDLLLEDRRSR